PNAQFIPFSAFWLRSSVVSVFINLISDMWAIGRKPVKIACYLGFHESLSGFSRIAHAAMRCTIARTWLNPPNQ
ncbi:hypothetical protein BRARA_F03786, partial [Brassica rapa]